MHSVLLDIRHSLRSLAKQRGFVCAAVLSLALGIGVNTAIFSALNALLFRALPVVDVATTVYVFHATPANADRGMSFPGYLHYRDRTETFANVAAFGAARPMIFSAGDRREQVYAEVVTADFFALANTTLHLGRAFDRDVDRAADPQFVAVMSHTLWQRRFASDSTIVGRTITLNGRAFTVVGVAGAGFAGFDLEAVADLWIPMTTWAHLVGEPGRLTSDEHWMTMLARLRAGVTVDQAQGAMDAAGQVVQRVPGQRTRIRPVGQWRLAGAFSDILFAAAGALAVGLLVLALACTNVANLLIARAAARQREMSIRVALGGTRARLARLWLIESALLCAAAGLLSFLVSWWVLDLVVAFKPPMLLGHPDAPLLPLRFHIDVRVFVFTLALSFLTAALVGLVAAWQSSQRRTLRFAPGFNVRSAVIALQMALSLLLLLPCGLFVRSWMNASTIAPGFSADRVLILPISTQQGGVRIRKPPAFDQQLADRVRALPGVEAAAVMDPVPLWFAGNSASFQIDGASGARTSHQVEFSRVTPGHFETLRLPLRRGRDFTAADSAPAPKVAIVNETMARRFWPDGDALGRRIRNRGDVIEIVGIAQDAKYRTLAGSSPSWLYRPLAQNTTDNPSLSLAVRTSGDPLLLRAAIEREVRALVPEWPAFQFRTLDEGLKLQRLLPRAAATLLGALGVFGMCLASVGVYGVMAYVVKQRTPEIGIRLALGAPMASVLALVVRQGMAVCLVGAAVGIALALAATHLLGSFLYGVGSADPLTFAVVPLALMAVALFACYLPARGITGLNALAALRD